MLSVPSLSNNRGLSHRAALGQSHDDAGTFACGERCTRRGFPLSLERIEPGRARRSRPHGERHPRAGDGRGRKGQIRPSRPAHGRGRCRHRAVHPLPQIRSGRSGLARPRPLRALGRPRLDAALRAVVSPRLRGDDDRRDQALPPARLAHARPSRARPHARRRDHHRAARPGFANAVGMAIAERHLAAVFGSDIVDHTTYVLAPTAT